MAAASPAVESLPWVRPPIGEAFAVALANSRAGDVLPLPRPLELGGEYFRSAAVMRVFGTASGARLLQLLPGAVHCIWKRGDVRHEYAVMCALQYMNSLWRRSSVAVCGVPVEAVTYDIVPIGDEAGLIEVVHESRTLRELGRDIPPKEKHLRVVRALDNDVQRLNMLAASTVAYLTAGYALGIRDGHDDNIMLRADGALFRIDFGFVFGATPEIDTPQTVIPRAVACALGEQRWSAAVAACQCALLALTGDAAKEPPAWDCLSHVPELALFQDRVNAHLETLSLADFARDVECADQWSLTRAAKNALREAVRFWREDDGDALDVAVGAAQAVPGLLPERASPLRAPQQNAEEAPEDIDRKGQAVAPLPEGDPFACTPPASPRERRRWAGDGRSDRKQYVELNAGFLTSCYAAAPRYQNVRELRRVARM